MITMRPSDVPTYVEAGAADLGITGKDVLLEQSAQSRRRGRPPGVRAARPRLRPLHDGARQQGRARPGRRGAAPARRHARRHQVPAHRRPPPRGDRPPGRDRRGQGLGRARPADGPGRGDRRPHRHRHHAAREQPRDPRGDRRLHRAADRQPRGPQAQGRGDRRPAGPRPRAARAQLPRRVSQAGADRCASSGSTPRRSPSSAPAAWPHTCARWSPAAASVADGVAAIIDAVQAEGDEAVPSTPAASTPPRARPLPLRVAPEELDAAISRCRSSSSPGCRSRSPTSPRSPRPGVGADGAVSLPQGHRIALRELPGARRPPSTCPAAGPPTRAPS